MLTLDVINLSLSSNDDMFQRTVGLMGSSTNRTASAVTRLPQFGMLAFNKA